MVTENKSKAAHRKAGSASPVEADMDANKKSRATQGIQTSQCPCLDRPYNKKRGQCYPA